MNRISQNHINMLKNRLKNKISSLSDEMIDYIVSNLFNVNENVYLNLIDTIQQYTFEIIKSVIIEVFKELDNNFIDSYDRLKLYNINKSNVKRTIITIVGEITFYRTYFQSKDKSKKFFYIDELFHLPKYDHYDPIIKGLTIEKTFNTNQIIAGKDVGQSLTSIKKLASDIRNTYSIPRQTINNWINNWNNPKIVFDLVDNTPETLYIMADEKFIGCQDLDNDIMTKCFVIFEGIEKISRNRNKLVNRMVLSRYSSNPWPNIVDTIAQKYDFQKIKHIVLLGDGASWIKSGINELKMEPDLEVSFKLCTFHFKQAIHRITTDTDLRNELINSFFEETKSEFKERIDNIKLNDYKRADKIDKNANYIFNNYDYIKYETENNIGSSMESHISHCISNMFASRPKGYSSKNITKYLEINDYKNNNMNIFNLYLNTYENEEQIEIKKTNIDFSIFENSNSNMPIIYNTQNINLRNTLINLKGI